MNYYNETRNKIIDNEIYRRVKDYSKGKKQSQNLFQKWEKSITKEPCLG